MKLKGQLEQAQLENKSSDPTNLPDGLVWYNTTTKLMKAVVNAVKVQFLTASIPQTTFAIANNQSSAADVTGLLFSSSTARSGIIDYQIRRVSTSTGAVERVEAGQLLVTYNTLATTWSLAHLAFGGEDSLVDFSITSGGQVQYTSDNMAGTYDSVNSLMTFVARTF